MFSFSCKNSGGMQEENVFRSLKMLFVSISNELCPTTLEAVAEKPHRLRYHQHSLLSDHLGSSHDNSRVVDCFGKMSLFDSFSIPLLVEQTSYDPFVCYCFQNLNSSRFH